MFPGIGHSVWIVTQKGRAFQHVVGGDSDTHLHSYRQAWPEHELHAADITLGAVTYDDLRGLDSIFWVQLCSN
jgi:hypothetical protein